LSPRRRILPIFVPHAGCPNDCVFCNQKRISGSLFPASGDMVREALEAVSPGAGLELAFYGGSFTAIEVPRQLALLEAVQPARSDGRIASIRVSTRPDAIDLPTLERLRFYGVETIELGAQSLCDEVLRRSGRGHTEADVINASHLVKNQGFALILQMMTGLPGDTPRRSLETARKIIALAPDGVRIYPTVVVRDTALETLWRSGAYQEHTVEAAVSLCAMLLPLFEQAGIPVIRLGLNPSEELSGGAALAGAYHPAFGELVRSRILRKRVEGLLSPADRGAYITLYTAPNRVSPMVGQKRCNIIALTERFSLSGLRVRPDSMLQGDEIRLARTPNT